MSPYRVVDLTDERGQYVGLLLAQLGAEVCLVEPPGTGRRPSNGDICGRAAWNRGKRSVVLDASPDAVDRARLVSLVASADVVIESAPPGEMDALGLGYDVLSAGHPGLIYASVTPFGSDGPKVGWAATDLTVWAAAGPMALTGDSDRPPLRVPGGQAFLHASAELAGAVVAALIERSRSGLGQRIDVSAQQAASLATQAQILAFPVGDELLTRVANGSRHGPIVNRWLYRASDGWVIITLSYGPSTGPFTRRLIGWMVEEGHADPMWLTKDWNAMFAHILSGAEPADFHEQVKASVDAFTVTKTKAELFAAALERKLLVAPVATPDEILASEQLAHRRYWDGVGSDRAPGRWAHITPHPLRSLPPAPAVGSDNRTGWTRKSRPAMARPAAAPAAPPEPPLAGLKVLDFTWSMAGPMVGRVLADYGATVVRIDSPDHPDLAAGLRPMDRLGAAPFSAAHCSFNAGKYSLALDLKSAAARPVVDGLLRWCDVACESFSAGTMDRLGWGYPELRRLNPQAVMLSSTVFGQDGPLSGYAAFGNTAAALAGFTSLTGWPDRPPAGPYSAYTDYVSPRLALAAVLAAVDHRRRTGEGSWIDFSQLEAALSFLAPTLMAAVQGRPGPGAVGNADPEMAPHGVYRCAGPDRWLAIACPSTPVWHRLADIIGAPALAGLATFERQARAEELDVAIESWTTARSELQAEAVCQAAGIPAHRVQNSRECWEDPQLQWREHFRPVADPDRGRTWVMGPAVRFSRSVVAVRRPGPSAGQDNLMVLKEILGWDDERVAELVGAGALQ